MEESECEPKEVAEKPKLVTAQKSSKKKEKETKQPPK